MGLEINEVRDSVKVPRLRVAVTEVEMTEVEMTKVE